MRIRKWAVIVACGILILTLMAYIYPGTLPNVRPAKASSVTISLVATLVGGYTYYWNTSNPPITVTLGDTVTIQLSSANGVSHQLLVDFDNDYSGGADCTTTLDKCSMTFGATPTSFSFTASTAGTFHYYCTIHYPSMVGTFTVQNPPPSPDYSLSANPSSVSIVQGANANSTITVSSLNGFMGTISLSASSTPPGPMPVLQPNSVTIPPSATSKLTISIPSTTPTGSYTVTVKGMNSTTTRSTSLAVTVTAPAIPDFSISSDPSTITVAGSGWSVTTSVSLTSLNGFSGTVNLSASISPSGPLVTISPATVTLTEGRPATSTLTMTASSAGVYTTPTPPGSYTVTITATTSSLSHSTTVPLTVASPSPSGISTLTVELIVGGAIAAVAIVGAVVYLIRRRPTRTS